MSEDQTVINLQDHTSEPAVAGTDVVKINREFQEKSTMRMAKDLNLPYINISKTPLNPDFLKIISLADSQLARVICFFQVGKKVRLAVEDPKKAETLSIIERLKSEGKVVDLSLTSSDGINDALSVYSGAEKYKKIEIVKNVAEEAIGTYEKEISTLAELPTKITGLTAEQGLNLLNVGAMKTGASDIHYEPEEGSVVVRFRIDGVLHRVFDLSYELYKTLVSQIKYEGKMQMNVDNVPQDGRYSFDFNQKKIGVRVSTIPTPYGESFVCRFLVSPERPLTLEELGFAGLALVKLKKAAQIPNGMVLVTGPTGSGKTTTLYSMLSMMKTPENKVITLEDPVEYHISGVTQSQINEKRGYTFGSGLRTLLRQDPDIVMLGEIRDLEAAETAAQAALTGHVLLSTLHTNSAIETIPRLMNMGLQSFMIAPALNTIVAQRLVRKVCSSCSVKEAISESAKQEFEMAIEGLRRMNPEMALEVPSEVPKAMGCDKCSNTGYQGRLVISEVITVNHEMKRLILNNASSVDLITAARKEGITTMREDGLLKVAQGLTTLEEVYRVTNVLA
ncbi:type II/IV secretion system protein [Candidatus Gracilibacteria bacterium]|nr:type II/IV secretion system protein [Candidatus Gracilibacteria bacterium]